MIGPAPIDRLRRIAASLRDGNDIDGPWFMSCLAEYESGARFGRTIDDALGLSGGRGKTSWWEAEANVRRDDLLRQFCKRWFSDLSHREAAKEIARKVGRYEAARWKQHRAFTEPPAGLNEQTCMAFRILKTHALVTTNTVERALRHLNDDQMPHRVPSNADTTHEERHGRTDDDESQTDPRPSGNPIAAAGG